MSDIKTRVFDLIEKHVVDKGKALQEELLRNTLVQAFPPDDLEPSQSFKSTANAYVDLDAIIAKYSPYYEYTKTIETEYYENGDVEKIVETLDMKLIDPKPYKKLLLKLKYIHPES